MAVLGVVIAGAVLGAHQDVVPAPVAARPSPSAPASNIPAVFVPHAMTALAPTTPRSLIVRGWVARTSDAAGVMIRSGSGSTIAVAPMDPTGKPRNGMVPFETSFSLERGRIDPAQTLFVIATDARGRPLPGAVGVAVQGAVVEVVVR